MIYRNYSATSLNSVSLSVRGYLLLQVSRTLSEVSDTKALFFV